MKKVRKKLIREKAVIAVYQYLLTECTTEEIETYLNAYYAPRMDEEEVALCKELILKVLDNQDEFKETITQRLKKGWTLDRLSLMNQSILLVSLQNMTDTPKEIVINEAIELSKKYCDKDDYKFINGVLSTIE
ncbi:transcription antitermination factor NusB [[Clostridium] spiroforme]|nr:transcription antitermination factor NusB [Thomasclavelia spiroformis]MBM6879766.1 transcription antitermination factor NusB [Thomasclavelia spiroformis]MBM6930600.1 transcription antitermination factor NusB [Thomasclavelia spiroformis]